VRLAAPDLLPAARAFSHWVSGHREASVVDAVCLAVGALLVAGEFGYWGARFPELTGAVEQEAEAARGLAGLAHDQDFPVIVSTMNKGRSPAVDQLLSAGVPVHRKILAAARVLAHLTRIEATLPAGLPEPPPSAERLPEGDYWAARRALAAAGVPFVPARVVHSADEALAAARELGYPLALKAVGLLHKSDAGGVTLDIRDEPLLRAACDDLLTRLAPSALTVERMAPLEHGVEMIVGSRQAPRFGPVVLVGLGGTYTEILKDTVVALAPASTSRRRSRRAPRSTP
jgi:acyl-CoA synthetase (NDP forming)